MFLLIALLLLASCVLFVGRAVLRDPEILRRSAQAEVDLYRVHRSLDATQLKQDIRRDDRRLRRELRNELDRFG